MLRQLTLLAPALGLAAAACTQALLREATERYLAVQSSGNASWLQPFLTNNATYIENGKTIAGWTSTSTLTTFSLRIDRSHSIFDLTQCAAFTDLIVTDAANPRAIGAQITVDPSSGKVSKIDRIATTTGDWLFNATGTLYYALREDWGEIPLEKRDSRAVIKAAADAYLDIFKNASVVVPWGSPCARLEGGAYTGRGLPTDTCNVGVIQSYDMPNRRYVIDETVGVVSVLLEFGSIGNAPDSHLFRVEGGKLRFIHTLTYCEKKPNCGYTIPSGAQPPTRM
ncbi:hypothetical protein B0H63DRAFT_552532 [Podospora didyma]|uniref:DUF8021 domain-containing protein n=1 Tax=Podospora didyma TaxID=330526 RepID=A0AAE0K5H5_9PEZI|nr:hypothetical protein B0H63DRAFT_552532 [Podospora didyma]